MSFDSQLKGLLQKVQKSFMAVILENFLCKG